MPISHVSEIIRANSWIQPFDVNLMAKVNSYKQTEFYQNAAKTENMITQLNNADVANPEQREYLKNKVNNLTSQLNNMGGINYSDMNIANTIEGYGAEIYGDEKVLNGISSTKSIREWQANVQKLKTDPKLSKYYNGANEAYDYEHYIKPYVTGGIDAKYEGPRAPKPYTGNPFSKVMEQMKTLRPDITTSIDPVTGNRFFFSKTENRRLSPEDITAALDGFIDGDTKQQLQIDSWYNYDYTTGGKFDKQTGLDVYTQDLDNAIRLKNEELQRVNQQIAVEPDVNEKAKWEAYRTKVNGELGTYTTRRNDMVTSFSKDWDKDPKNAKYKLYMTRFQQDVVKAAGYDENKTSLIVNQERMFQARQQLEYTKNGLYWDGVSFKADGTPFVMPVEGAETMIKQAKTGTTKTPLDVSNGLFHDLTSNTETNKEARSNKITEETLLKDNDQIDLDLTAKTRNFIEIAAKRGGYGDVLGFKTTPESNPGASPTVSTSPLLEQIQKVGDDRILAKEDIQFVLDRVGEQEKNIPAGSTKNNYKIRDDAGKEIALTKEQVGFFKNVMKNWDAVATGQLKADDAPMNISTSELAKFVNDYQTLDLVKKSNVSYISSVKAQAFEGSGLTPQQVKRYNYFLEHPDEATKKVLVGYEREAGGNQYSYKDNDEFAALKKASNIDQSAINKKIKASFANASDRQNFYSLYLPKVEELEKSSPGLVNKIRSHAVDEFGSDQNIQPLSITRTAEGKFMVEYVAGPEKKREKGTVELTTDEALKLGGQVFPNEPLERLLTYNTSSGDLYTYSTVFSQPIKYSIEREGNLRNSRTFVPYVYYGGEKIPVFAPDKQGYQGSANAAEYLIKQYITYNTATTIEQFIDGLKKLRNL